MKKRFSALLIFLLPLGAFAQTLKEGLRMKEVDRFENAKKIFRNLHQASPSAEHAYHLGDLYYTLDNPDSAALYFNEGIKLDPSFALNHVGLGKVVYPENAQEGKNHFSKALELTKSKDAAVLSAIAEFYISFDKLEVPQAFGLLDAAAKIDKKNPDILLLKGDGYWKIYDGSKALAQYEAALQMNPKYVKTIMKLGESYKNVKNFNRALEYYNQALALDPQYAPAYREMGDAYYRNKQYDKAIESYKKYVAMADPNDNVNLKYAAFLIQNRDFANALDLLKGMENKKDVNPAVYRLLAYAYYENGDNDKGLENMEKFLSKTDSKKYISADYEYYGKLLAKAGKDSLAVVNLETALGKDSSRWDLWGELASIYVKNRDFGKAITAYEHKIKKAPTTQDYFNLGMSYYYEKRYSEADTTFGTLIKYLPTYAHGYLWKAKAKSSLDPTQEKGLAKPYFEKFIELTRNEAAKNKKDLLTAYDYLGSYYLTVRNDKAKAKEAYLKMKELDPGNERAENGLRYVNAK